MDTGELPQDFIPVRVKVGHEGRPWSVVTLAGEGTPGTGKEEVIGDFAGTEDSGR